MRFTLGYEMAKAATALTLGKDYRQDEALDWGFLTRAEKSHRLKRPPTSPESSAQMRPLIEPQRAPRARRILATDETRMNTDQQFPELSVFIRVSSVARLPNSCNSRHS